MTRDNFLEIRNAGFAVDDKNEPVPDNIPVATTFNAVANTSIDKNTIDAEDWFFYGVDQWRTSSGGFFPPAKFKTTESSSIPHLSILGFFLPFYPCDYIKLVIIPQTNNCLAHSDIEFSGFLRFFGCWLYLDCFEVVVYRRIWWSNTEVNMFEVSPGRLTKYMSLNRFEDILRNLSYTDKNFPAYNDKFFHMRQMEDAWNANMTKVFEPSWVSVLDESMQEWISKYTCPAWMCVGRKPHPFGNYSHTIDCGFSKIMWFAEIVEGRDRPRERVRSEFGEIGKTLVTMLRCTRPIWKCEKVVIMDSGFCVTKGLMQLQNKGVFVAALIKKRRYWPANIKGDAIDAHFVSKEVGTVYAVKQVEYGVAYHVFFMKDPDYIMKLMKTYGTLDPMDKRTQRKFKRGGIMETKDFMYMEAQMGITCSPLPHNQGKLPLPFWGGKCLGDFALFYWTKL